MPREWVIPPPSPQRDELSRTLRISPIVAQVLCNRGVTDPEQARQFLRPQIADLHAPEAFPSTLRAADRILAAIAQGRKIVLFGDYDVDGITGVSILWHCIRLAGGEPIFHIPHRLEEGYGISLDAIRSLARDGAEMIISVDCGVTAIEPAELARDLGIELIITDHHHPKTDAQGRRQLPAALVVHPSIADEGEAVYPNPHLSGAGVAFKLAWAIAQRASGAAKVRPAFRDFLLDAIGLAAMGTVADVVPLVGENRVLVHHGLLGLPNSKLPGVQALLEMAGVSGKKLAGYDVGFKLGPRLNAIGRMGHAQVAVEMLTRAEPAEARRIAEMLDRHNKDRQILERRIIGEAHEMIAATGQDSDHVRAIVLASSGWHAGVVGIVAGRMAEVYGKPAVLIALENGIGQGSARSIRNFPLHEALAACGAYLLSHGGHAMAAGLRIASDQVDAFREALWSRAATMLTPSDLLPKLSIDDVASLGHLNTQLVADLGKLEPYGAGNPSPLLATEELKLVGEPRAVGNGGTHLQVTLSDGRSQCKGIAFGQASVRPQLMDHRRCRVAFRPIVNEWNGRQSVEMQISEFAFPGE